MNTDQLLIYLIISGVAALLIGGWGESKTVGFWGAVAISFFLTPLIGIIVVALSKDKKQLAKERAILKKAAQPTSVADELTKLAQLKESGILTEDEFNSQKMKLLSGE